MCSVFQATLPEPHDPASVDRAERVIAVSESTRQDVITFFGVPGERVVVVPNGVAETFQPADPAEVADFRRSKGLPEHFILFLGTLNRARTSSGCWRLMRCGCTGVRRAQKMPLRWSLPAQGLVLRDDLRSVNDLGLTDHVIFPGFVPAEELPWWYRAAGLFVYPSLFEGFGLPVLEAMACGTPTITSNASSLPEVAGTPPC